VERVKIPLDHGTLLIMEGATQADWQVRMCERYGSSIEIYFFWRQLLDSLRSVNFQVNMVKAKKTNCFKNEQETIN
jgi:hypothetical protein